MTSINSNGESTPFWNMNIPASHHTKECPDYLQYAFKNAKDHEILSTPDAQYQRMSWPEVQQVIRDNRLEKFVRVPSDLRRYREYCAQLTEKYGSIMKFVMQERLQWSELSPRSSGLFEDASDYKILFNDWPYGLDERIKHLVVWVKFEIPTDPASPDGELTSEARKEIDGFVDRVFVKKCGQENVIWFKNWTSLKSIHAVEHIHVMLYDPDKYVDRILQSIDDR